MTGLSVFFIRIPRLSLTVAVLLALLMSGLGFSAQAMTRTPLAKNYLIEYLRQWEAELEEQKVDAFEKDLEKEFILRLRFQVERRYTNDDASLRRILVFMLELEEQPGNRSLSYFTLYLREMIRAIDSIREPTENLARFVRQFTETAGIKDGLSADEFAKSRAYLNTLETETARDLDDSSWNELARRLDVVDDAETSPLAPSTPEPPPAVHATSLLKTDAVDDADIDPELNLLLETGEASEAPRPLAPRIQSLRPVDDSVVLK